MLTSLKDRNTLLLPFQYSCRRRRLPACRPHCLTAKQVAPNHESIRDVGLEEHARARSLEFLCPFSNFKMHKAHSVWAGEERAGGVCVGTGQSSILSPSTESTLRPAQEKEQFSLEASRKLFSLPFTWESSLGNFHIRPRPREFLLLFIAVNRGRASGTGKKY